jgi:hypothetical protein
MAQNRKKECYTVSVYNSVLSAIVKKISDGRAEFMDIEFKIALIRQFGNQSNAAESLRIDEPTLSKIVRGRRSPTAEQRKRLKKALGKDFFGKRKNPKAA